MKKFFLLIFILVDTAVIGVCVLFLYSRMSSHSGNSPFSSLPIPGLHTPPLPAAGSNVLATPPSAPTPSAAPVSASPLTQPVTPAAGVPVNGAGRKILFQYRNAKAKKVMIRADFTGWRAEPMQKDPATNMWKYTGVLEPGEYAYCFSVDDKSIRDPANKKTKQVGKTFVSSIVVQPLPPGKS